MKLTPVERWILANHFRILETLSQIAPLQYPGVELSNGNGSKVKQGPLTGAANKSFRQFVEVLEYARDGRES